jgi:NADPH:quinone reductase-like Zn-dependent oxidoreductase
MARHHGARVARYTARGAAKAEAARALAADLAIDRTAGDWGRGGARVGLAPTWSWTWSAATTSRRTWPRAQARRGGRATFAYQAGARVELDLRPVMLKRLTITGSTLRGRTADEKARLARAIESAVWPWVLDGRLRVPVDRAFPLGEAALAHARLEGGEHLGKVVLLA